MICYTNLGEGDGGERDTVLLENSGKGQLRIERSAVVIFVLKQLCALTLVIQHFYASFATINR